jgi:CBS domain-containing protein
MAPRALICIKAARPVQHENARARQDVRETEDGPMLASDVMTAPVATVRRDTPIGAAIAKMTEGRISGLPVVDAEDRLVGILTEGDLLRRYELGTAPNRPGWLNFLRGPGLAAADYVRTRTMHVEDVMTPAPVVVAPDVTLERIVATMERGRIKRVPVVRDGKLVGIVSRGDLIRALGRLLANPCAAVRDDEAVRADILAEIARQGWSGMSNVGVTVKEGRVTLEGIAQSEAVRDALRVAAEIVPGALAVDNQVALPDPMVMAIGA